MKIQLTKTQRAFMGAALISALAMMATGCETTSAAAGVATIAPAAKTVAKVCDVAEVWIGYVGKGVGIIGDCATKIASASTNTTTTVTAEE